MDTSVNNINLFYLIHNLSGKHIYADNFFILISTLILYFVIFAVFAHIFYGILKTKHPDKKVHYFKEGALLILSLSFAAVLVFFLKYYFAVPRPFVGLPNVKALIPYGRYDSFPSMHSAVAITLALGILKYHKKLGILLFIFALVVGFSRIYLGDHYPMDVLVGFLVGACSTLIFSFLFRKYIE